MLCLVGKLLEVFQSITWTLWIGEDAILASGSWTLVR